MSPDEQIRAALDSALRRTPQCIPLDKLDDPLDARQREHVATCLRCESEFAIWKDLRDSSPDAADDQEVEWITTKVEDHYGGARTPLQIRGWRRPSAPAWLGAAAAAVLVVAGAYLATDTEPRVADVSVTSQEYRGGIIQPLAPGDLVREAPLLLEWSPVEKATRYDVSVSEVDNRVVWKGVTSASRIALPADIVAQVVPGKTLLWQVRAFDQQGVTIGESGVRQFRRSPR